MEVSHQRRCLRDYLGIHCSPLPLPLPLWSKGENKELPLWKTSSHEKCKYFLQVEYLFPLSLTVPKRDWELSRSLCFFNLTLLGMGGKVCKFEEKKKRLYSSQCSVHHTGYFLLVLVYRMLTRMASSLLEENTSTELHSSTLLCSYIYAKHFSGRGGSGNSGEQDKWNPALKCASQGNQQVNIYSMLGGSEFFLVLCVCLQVTASMKRSGQLFRVSSCTMCGIEFGSSGLAQPSLWPSNQF